MEAETLLAKKKKKEREIEKSKRTKRDSMQCIKGTIYEGNSRPIFLLNNKAITYRHIYI